jgi:uncharacterized protein YukE
MSQRVVASAQAKQAATQMQQVLSGQLQDTLRRLDQLGTTLSQPNEWDGRLAQQFRSQEWPQVKSANQKMLQQLEQLQQSVQKIVQNIMQAGGD